MASSKRKTKYCEVYIVRSQIPVMLKSSDNLRNQLLDVAEKIETDANNLAQEHAQSHKKPFRYKYNPYGHSLSIGDWTPLAHVYTRTKNGARDNAKYNTLKKALDRNKI